MTPFEDFPAVKAFRAKTAQDHPAIAILRWQLQALDDGAYVVGSPRESLRDALALYDELLEALIETWRVIDAAGLQNLTRGVQLGQTSWFVKASDAEALARAAIARATPSPTEES
jgi:hypothetical protein